MKKFFLDDLSVDLAKRWIKLGPQARYEAFTILCQSLCLLILVFTIGVIYPGFTRMISQLFAVLVLAATVVRLTLVTRVEYTNPTRQRILGDKD